MESMPCCPIYLFYHLSEPESRGREGESDKASLGDRGTLRPEFGSPGEHSCSHTRALPLHIQFRPLLPQVKSYTMMVLPSPFLGLLPHTQLLTLFTPLSHSKNHTENSRGERANLSPSPGDKSGRQILTSAS
jgi:hypothetical protein